MKTNVNYNTAELGWYFRIDTDVDPEVACSCRMPDDLLTLGILVELLTFSPL